MTIDERCANMSFPTQRTEKTVPRPVRPDAADEGILTRCEGIITILSAHMTPMPSGGAVRDIARECPQGQEIRLIDLGREDAAGVQQLQ